MTPQAKLAAVGGLTAVAAKFYFGKDWQTAVLYGLAALSLVAILSAKDNTNPA